MIDLPSTVKMVAYWHQPFFFPEHRLHVTPLTRKTDPSMATIVRAI